MADESITRLLITLVSGSFGLFLFYVEMWYRADLLTHRGRGPKIVNWLGWELSRCAYVMCGGALLAVAFYQLWQMV